MKLHFRTYGKGDPLIILHGLFGTADNWNTIAKELSSDFLVYAVDQRNHGKSPHHQSHTYRDLAEDLEAFMEDHGLSSAHILGHSMGGSTAMQVADSYPSMVDRLVIVDIAPKRYNPKHDEIFSALFSLDLGSFSSRNDIDEALARFIDDTAVRQFLLKNVVRGEPKGFRWKFNLEVIRRCYDEIIGGPDVRNTFTNPVLFVKGEKSRYILEDDIPHIKQLYPAAEIVTIKDATHWVHADAPSEFAGTVRTFLLS
jgi:esterase